LCNEFLIFKHSLSCYSVNNIHIWLSKVKEKIFEEIKLKDDYFSWVMKADGSYAKYALDSANNNRSQIALIKE